MVSRSQPACWVQADAFPLHRGVCESLQLANNLACFSPPAAESKSCKLDFFLQYESVFSKALPDAHVVLKRLEESREIDATQKEVGVFARVNGRAFSFAPLRAGILRAQFGFMDNWGSGAWFFGGQHVLT